MSIDTLRPELDHYAQYVFCWYSDVQNAQIGKAPPQNRNLVVKILGLSEHMCSSLPPSVCSLLCIDVYTPVLNAEESFLCVKKHSSGKKSQNF